MTNNLPKTSRLQDRKATISRTAHQLLNISMWMALIGSAIVLLSAGLGWTWSSYLVALQGLMPVVTAVGVVGTLLALYRRFRTAMVVGAVVIGLALGIVGPTMIGNAAPAWAEDAPRLTLYAANLYHQNPTIEDALAVALATNADVVLFSEYTAEFEPALQNSGLLEEYPFVARAAAQRDIILSRLPTKDIAHVHSNKFDPTALTVTVGGEDIRVFAIHTQAPGGTISLPRWEQDFDVIAELTAVEPNVVAIGDYNATLWNAPMRELLGTGLVDAHDHLGRGVYTSWGLPKSHLRGIPGFSQLLGIDHSLSKGALVPISVSEADIPGSDHRSISVTYAVGDGTAQS